MQPQGRDFNRVYYIMQQGRQFTVPRGGQGAKGRCSNNTSNNTVPRGSIFSLQLKSCLESDVDCLTVGLKASFLQGLTNCGMSVTCAGNVLA